MTGQTCGTCHWWDKDTAAPNWSDAKAALRRVCVWDSKNLPQPRPVMPFSFPLPDDGTTCPVWKLRKATP